MTAPTPAQIVAKYYEIETLEGGLEVADGKRVTFLTALALQVDPADVRRVMIDELCKVGAG